MKFKREQEKFLEENWSTLKEKGKNVVFVDTPKRHADLHIKLRREENMNKSEFFRLMITTYLNNDERMLDIIREYKEEEYIQSKIAQKKVERQRRKRREIEKRFELTDDEIELIYSEIEEGYSDL